jgi:hypothetical protein
MFPITKRFLDKHALAKAGAVSDFSTEDATAQKCCALQLSFAAGIARSEIAGTHGRPCRTRTVRRLDSGGLP